ncbi:MAG TPA: nitronate monooxygenase [Stellaceae bacterium]|nr:nitronate monooxygenase [Stellaceae bacterium]
MAANDLLRRLGIEQPIIQGPMGGGPSTPELVAAVSNAGGLGSLGAAYLTPEQIADAIRRIRALTERPFNVNLFAGAWQTASAVDPAPMLAVLAEIHAALGLPAPTVPVVPPDPFEAQLEAVLAARPPIFSFTFGIPGNAAMARIKESGAVMLGTATTVHEGRMLAEAGADAVVAQGAEAGAHRGTFASPFAEAMIPTLDLVAGIAASVRVPVIASGGIMDGGAIATAMARGAAAAQLGTAFLVCPESGAPAAHKQAILAAREDRTVITRAFSGRPARGIANAFMAKLAGREDVILPYPLQNMLTRAMRTAAAKGGDAGFLSLWAGTGAPQARALAAGALVARLAEEMRQAR